MQISWTEKDSYSSATVEGKILWNPYMAVETNTGYVLSPAECLSHEADHARDYKTNPNHRNNLKKYDKQYDNKEEKRVIEGSEQKVAKALGKLKENQVTRMNHQSTNARVSGPTSSDIEEPELKKYKTKL